MSRSISRQRRRDADQERKAVGPAGEVLDLGPDRPMISLADVPRYWLLNKTYSDGAMGSAQPTITPMHVKNRAKRTKAICRR